MTYKGSLAQQAYDTAIDLEELLKRSLPFQDGATTELILEGIVRARDLRELATRRLDRNERQRGLRDGSSEASLPSPRSKHVGD